jgi:hypothetical protein
MSDFQPYKYRATGVGTFQVEGPGLEGCVPIWDHEVDAGRCVLAMNDAWRASRKHAVSYLEARSQHFRRHSLTHTLSVDARSRCAVQAQCLRAEAIAVGRWDVLETETRLSAEHPRHDLRRHDQTSVDEFFRKSPGERDAVYQDEKREQQCIEAWLLARGAERIDSADAEALGVSRWRVPGRPGAAHDGGIPHFWFAEEWKADGSPAPSKADDPEPRALCSDCGELHVSREDCPVERHWTDCPKCFQRNGPDTDDCAAFHCSGCGHDYVPKQPTETTPQVASERCWRCGHDNRVGDVCPC